MFVFGFSDSKRNRCSCIWIHLGFWRRIHKKISTIRVLLELPNFKLVVLAKNLDFFFTHFEQKLRTKLQKEILYFSLNAWSGVSELKSGRPRLYHCRIFNYELNGRKTKPVPLERKPPLQTALVDWKGFKLIQDLISSSRVTDSGETAVQILFVSLQRPKRPDTCIWMRLRKGGVPDWHRNRRGLLY